MYSRQACELEWPFLCRLRVYYPITATQLGSLLHSFILHCLYTLIPSPLHPLASLPSVVPDLTFFAGSLSRLKYKSNPGSNYRTVGISCRHFLFTARRKGTGRRMNTHSATTRVFCNLWEIPELIRSLVSSRVGLDT